MSIFEEIVEKRIEKSHEKGVEKGIEQCAIKLWQQGDMPIAKIASVLETPIEQLREWFTAYDEKARRNSLFESFIQDGKDKEKLETVIRGWRNGLDTSVISSITELSVDVVEKTIADYQ